MTLPSNMGTKTTPTSLVSAGRTGYPGRHLRRLHFAAVQSVWPEEIPGGQRLLCVCREGWRAQALPFHRSVNRCSLERTLSLSISAIFFLMAGISGYASSEMTIKDSTRLQDLAEKSDTDSRWTSVVVSSQERINSDGPLGSR
jgi:hypothetical protein